MNPGLCMAPSTYAGICSYSVNTSAMVWEQKRSYAQKCGANFPCLGNGLEAKSTSDQAHALLPDGPVADSGEVKGLELAAIASASHAKTDWIAQRFAIPSGPLQ